MRCFLRCFVEVRRTLLPVFGDCRLSAVLRSADSTSFEHRQAGAEPVRVAARPPVSTANGYLYCRTLSKVPLRIAIGTPWAVLEPIWIEAKLQINRSCMVSSILLKWLDKPTCTATEVAWLIDCSQCINTSNGTGFGTLRVPFVASGCSRDLTLRPGGKQ
jgi:hypothetical protein